MKERPLAYFSGCFFASLFLLNLFVPLYVVIAVGFAVATVAVLIQKETSIRRIALCMFLPLFLAILLYTGWQTFYFNALPQQAHIHVRGYYEEEGKLSPGGVVTVALQVEEIDGKKLLLPLRLIGFRMPDYGLGAQFSGELKILYRTAEEQDVSAQGRGIVAKGAPTGAVVLEGKRESLLFTLRRLQLAIGALVREMVGGSQGPVAAGMTIGDGRYLPQEIYKAFRSTGTSHLLVVSGFQVTLLAAVLLQLLRRFMTPRRRNMAAMTAVLLFMAAMGFTPSVVRAAIMAAVLLFLPFTGREADMPTSLLFAAFVITVFTPYAAVDIGLLLSFSSVAGILFYQQQEQHKEAATTAKQRWKKAKEDIPKQDTESEEGFAEEILVEYISPLAKEIGGYLKLSIYITLATLPALALAGGEVSVLSPFANLFAVPLSVPILYFGLLAAVLRPIPVLGLLAPVFAFAAKALINVLLLIIAFFSSVRGARLHLTSNFMLFILAGGAAVWGF